MLAMDSIAPRSTSKHALSLTTIASVLAPTDRVFHTSRVDLITLALQTAGVSRRGVCLCGFRIRPAFLALT